MPWEWAVTANSDIIEVDMPFNYQLKVLLLLTGSLTLMDRSGTNLQHFAMTMHLSFDDMLDDDDYEIALALTSDQIASLQVMCLSFNKKLHAYDILHLGFDICLGMRQFYICSDKLMYC